MLTSVREEVRRTLAAQQEDLIAMLQQLIRIPSPTGEEGAVQAYIAQRLKNLGLAVELFEADPEAVHRHPEYTRSEIEEKYGFRNRPNVAATLKGAGGGRSLLAFTHVDTVPEGDRSHWRVDPFGGHIEGGRLYGRGAADNKSGYALVMAALQVLRAMNVTLCGDVTAVSVVDEEVGGAGGAVALVQKGYRADACLYPHSLSTGLAPQIACAGGLIFTVTVRGRSAHNLDGQMGVNAIGKMMKVYDALVALDEERSARVRYAPFEAYFRVSGMPERASNLVAAVIAGGEWAYRVCADAKLTCSIGFPPTETPNSVRAEIESCIQAVAEGDPWLQANPPRLEWQWQTSAAETDSAHPIVQLVKRNVEDVLGREVEILGIPTFSDIRFPILYMDMPTVCYGPMAGNLHGADEWLDVNDWLRAVEITVITLMDWCGVATEARTGR
jgi:acetylornithine deacetylase